MTVPRVSIVVITLDEEDHLRRCLESVAWADEIVVVDAESRDKTVQIACEFTDRVISRPWAGFATQKNFAVEQTTGDWVFSLDAALRGATAPRARCWGRPRICTS